MDEALERLRGICLRYPEAEEAGGVGKRLLAQLVSDTESV
jgi:hypothetical protein